ncbi:MAG TPA: hypothetical protein VIT24_14900, partial [Acidimicrobiales bacterium]
MTTIPSPAPYAAPLDGTRAGAHVSARTGWMAVAGLASLGAGAIHAAAIGVHAEHRPAAVTFAVIAAFQLAWGALALIRSNRIVALLGIGIGLGAVAGWIWAKAWGIAFIPGLDVAEPVQTADGLAAGLAAASVLLIGLALWTSRKDATPSRPPMIVAGLGLTALSVFGMIAAGTHVHSHGAGGHSHGTTIVASQEPQVVVPYDPTQPINFSGVPGVTPEQQAAAENIVSATLLLLPQWSDPEYALAHGFQSIGDGFLGTEHFINDSYIDDDKILDPTRPESLVWDTTTGERRLVAAMYMLRRGTPLEDAPNIGGSLMQWHIHNNLCYTPAGQVVGITNSDGECGPGLVLPEPTPMIHVW